MKEKIQKNKNILIILALVIVFIAIIIYKVFFGKSDEPDINIVKSSSKFYTVSNCVSRYLNYLYYEDTENMILLLDNSYKKKNHINNSNVFNNIDKLDGLYNFDARKMYEEIISDSITKYYVYGYLLKDDIDLNSYSDKKDFYIIVYLNSDKLLYSVAPYDGELFTDGGKE